MLEEKKFQKKKEDFNCEHCGAHIKGTGYTNHCPKCLWSKHVDINPGDRKSECKGLMKPVAVTIKSGKYIIYYKCVRCNYTFKVKSAENDIFEEILKLAGKPIKN